MVYRQTQARLQKDGELRERILELALARVADGGFAALTMQSLAEDVSRPVAYYAGGLTDVSACAYDPGDASWLMFSPSVGVVRLDAQSRAEIVFEPTTSYTFVRASFY